MVDIVENRSLKDHFNDVWASGKSPWKFSHDLIVSRKKTLLLPIIKNSDSILDLGCGGGEFLNFVLDKIEKKPYIIGVDIAEQAIKNAKLLEIYEELYISNIDNIQNDITSKIDLILLNEVLYYQKDYLEILNKLMTLSNKYIFISLAMGDDFFNKDDIYNIKDYYNINEFKLRDESIIDYTRFRIPWRYLKYFTSKQVSQTHKHILIFEKVSNE